MFDYISYLTYVTYMTLMHEEAARPMATVLYRRRDVETSARRAKAVLPMVTLYLNTVRSQISQGDGVYEPPGVDENE